MRNHSNFVLATSELFVAVLVINERLSSMCGFMFVSARENSANTGKHLVVEKTGKVQGRFVDE